jgi:hypothetical protein
MLCILTGISTAIIALLTFGLIFDDMFLLKGYYRLYLVLSFYIGFAGTRLVILHKLDALDGVKAVKCIFCPWLTEFINVELTYADQTLKKPLLDDEKESKDSKAKRSKSTSEKHDDDSDDEHFKLPPHHSQEKYYISDFVKPSPKSSHKRIHDEHPPSV